MSGHQRKVLKVVILGDAGVGKTSLMNRYSTGKFTGQYKATIGADFLTKKIFVHDGFGRAQEVTLQIWDTAGQERFQSLGVGFYRGADACMLVYDITDPHSLDNLERWRNEFLTQIGGGLGGLGGLDEMSSLFPFVVMGNKMDKEAERLVPLERAEEWCRNAAGQSHAMGVRPLAHYETSAKTNFNVDESFREISRQALVYEDFKRRSTPQLFIPPPEDYKTIQLRQETVYGNSRNNPRNEGCC